MTNRLIQLLLGLSLLLNTFVLAGFVYRSWIVPPPPPFDMRPPMPPPGPRPSPVEALIHDLGLDDAQRQALRGLVDQYTAARRERSQEIQKAREQTADEMRQPEFDMAKVEGLVDRVAALRAEQHKASLHTIVELEPKLRPEQRERLRLILAERLAGSRPPPPGGPPPGGPPRTPQ
ncbi:MAG: periplasmic heavy metal sensor [Reyranella sp.]|nr:periplasmic heavy metal sensor [Reyranella sp.]